MNENDGHFLHRQAELCIALSRSTFDLTVAGRLRAMAEEFHRKASEWQDEGANSPRTSPAATARSEASRAGVGT